MCTRGDWINMVATLIVFEVSETALTLTLPLTFIVFEVSEGATADLAVYMCY